MPTAATSENSDSPIPEQDQRRPEIGPALKRDRLLQRVRAARKRLTPAGPEPKLR
jgi:hypothetical protein